MASSTTIPRSTFLQKKTTYQKPSLLSAAETYLRKGVISQKCIGDSNLSSSSESPPRYVNPRDILYTTHDTTVFYNCNSHSLSSFHYSSPATSASFSPELPAPNHQESTFLNDADRQWSDTCNDTDDSVHAATTSGLAQSSPQHVLRSSSESSSANIFMTNPNLTPSPSLPSSQPFTQSLVAAPSEIAGNQENSARDSNRRFSCEHLNCHKSFCRQCDLK